MRSNLIYPFIGIMRPKMVKERADEAYLPLRPQMSAPPDPYLTKLQSEASAYSTKIASTGQDALILPLTRLLKNR